MEAENVPKLKNINQISVHQWLNKTILHLFVYEGCEHLSLKASHFIEEKNCRPNIINSLYTILSYQEKTWDHFDSELGQVVKNSVYYLQRQSMATKGWSCTPH